MGGAMNGIFDPEIKSLSQVVHVPAALTASLPPADGIICLK